MGLLCCALCYGAAAAPAQSFRPDGFALTAQSLPATGLLRHNEVSVLLFIGNDTWLGTGDGIAVLRASGATGQVTVADGIGQGSIGALAYAAGVVWVSTAFDSTIRDEGSFSVGSGLAYSTDDGGTWTSIAQPVDAPGDSLDGKRPTTVAVNNLTFDIAIRDGVVWIASFAGGLRKSTDNGVTWEVVTPDGLPFDVLGNLNHRTFAVISADNGLWAGTSGGINRSTDGGQSWTNFRHRADGSGISGNFVTALAEQRWDGRSIIWGATWQAEGDTEFTAVSVTRNNGFTWSISLEGERVHNFAFDGPDVYAVSDNGLFKSIDFGATWFKFPPIGRSNARDQVLTQEYFTVGVRNGNLWVGTKDGLVRQTFNSGLPWDVSRAFVPTGANGTITTYAYPNPFSPLRHNLLGGDGHVRFQYNTPSFAGVTLRIYDFSMKKVRTVVDRVSHVGAGDHAEIWNGRDDTGRMVDNGVYFYRLDLNPGGTHWGKIVVLN